MSKVNIDSVKPYAKALVGFVTPGVISLVAAVQDSSPGGSSVTGPEVVGIVAACILTGGAVFATPNKDPQGAHQEESTQPPELADPANVYLVQGDKPLPPEPTGYMGGV